MDWPRLLLLFLLLPCVAMSETSKPKKPKVDRSCTDVQCDNSEYCKNGKCVKSELIFVVVGEFVTTPPPCDNRNCGCNEVDGSCKSKFETTCSGSPRPTCYVPPGIICNATIGICECDRKQGLIWGESSKKCQVMPGGKCNSTAECVKGSICEGSQCSACPESKVVDPGSGECRFKLNKPCKIDDVTDSRVCPRGTECKSRPSGSICMCHSENGLYLEYDPRINECRHEKPFQVCKPEGYGFAPKCKIGTKCEMNGWLTIGGNDEYKQHIICTCDESMGLTDGSNSAGQNWELTEDHNYYAERGCFIKENYPCNPNQGFKCENTNKVGKLAKCLEGKQSGEFKCTTVDRDAGHMGTGSVLIMGIGLATIGAL